MKVRTSLGIAAGVLAAAISAPYLLRNQDTVKVTDPKTALIKEEDYDFINSLRCDCGDRRVQEIKWTEAVYPTIRKRLIALYKAEFDDIQKLRAREISEKDRLVKTYISDFVEAWEEADDMGIGPNIHVIKYFDEKQQDGSMLRTYVNEHWGINEKTGKVLLPDYIRVRAQVFKGSLYEGPSKHNLFVTDMLQFIWTKKDGIDYPFMARQHFYGEMTPDKKGNLINQTEVMMSNPRHCMGCHTMSHNNNHAHHVFHETQSGKMNYGAITQDYRFEKPVYEHSGFKKLMDFLSKKVAKGEMKQEDIYLVAKELQDPTSLANSSIINALENNDPIPWLDDDFDTKLKEPGSNKILKEPDPGREGFTYENGDLIWERAIYHYYKDRLKGTGKQWSKNDFQVIPRIKTQ